jgi:hypothetical protein
MGNRLDYIDGARGKQAVKVQKRHFENAEVHKAWYTLAVSWIPFRKTTYSELWKVQEIQLEELPFK